MLTYTKRAQVLLTEQQYRDLQEIAKKSQKKISTLIREALEATYLKRRKQQRIRDAVNRLLFLKEVPAPDDYQEWEDEYLRSKYFGHE